MSDPATERAIEAILFAAAAPLDAESIATTFAEPVDVAGALEAIATAYAERGINLVERGGRWHFETAPDLAHLLRTRREVPRRLGRPALETLAIIAYHEPASRAEVEAIRGVAVAAGTLDLLMDEGWVRIAGRREMPGRPLLYATTPTFLDHFGLASLRDLPGLAELRATGLLDPAPGSGAQLEVETSGDDD